MRFNFVRKIVMVSDVTNVRLFQRYVAAIESFHVTLCQQTIISINRMSIQLRL